MLIKVPSSAQDFGATMMEDSFISFQAKYSFSFYKWWNGQICDLSWGERKGRILYLRVFKLVNLD